MGFSWPALEPRGPESGKEGQCSRTSSGRNGGHGWWAPERFRSKEAAASPACGFTVPTQHCGPGPGAERAHSGLGDTVCPNRSAPGSGMTDRTAPGESRAQGKARLGEAGGAEWVSTLRREVGCRQGEVQQSGSEPARHWPPEPVAKVGLAGDDGAVIGASATRTGDEGECPTY